MLQLSGALQDLNDLYFFAAVVEHGGFSAAGRALGVPKSRLSKRVAQLEDRLGVRLLQRTTRRFVVTEVGERFYAHCRAVLEEARAAQDAVDELRAEPRGVVRLSCPVSLTQTILAYVLPDFMALYPRLQVRVLSSDRRVDLLGEGYDLAIRVRTKLDTDANMVMRSFGQSRVLPVASPALLDALGRPRHPEELAKLPALSMAEHEGPQTWELIDAAGERVSVEVSARLICGDFAMLLEAARRGIGVTMLPEFVCAPAVTRGELEVLLPEWSAPEGTMHFVYPSRRGMLPGVRALVDFLAERLPAATLRRHEECKTRPLPELEPRR
ncbi:MAG: LysR family transcriptional regulator [Rhodanobacter sp. 68-29]|uniref:LysR substrate-binding domain-containing protein n=1 Tax=Rhodanobacter sp. PCA2 TaxID=2006117 RepID=UPI00086F7485|nr:LysR substrate-binding domain-containing protein [Rhodanobacter sp. PCA2]MBA2078550.1 LysR family transcriptional regulator [Rhodanobacter sp. PCA2]MBN8921659.1 LysR family transcriptional regulator [Rhodanobacter sp.]ODV27835.1 MAG: LysR family transcriptional regulator [Rhodanobacter sp. SCN 68-63]OJY61345.1 MAG: LysR family transcriptional regulator [Rhodanobacter sp. 68-29]